MLSIPVLVNRPSHNQGTIVKYSKPFVIYWLLLRTICEHLVLLCVLNIPTMKSN